MVTISSKKFIKLKTNYSNVNSTFEKHKNKTIKNYKRTLSTLILDKVLFLFTGIKDTNT